MYTLTIKVTKDILKRSALCGVIGGMVSTNCAVALAVRDIFPYAQVDGEYISFDWRHILPHSPMLPIEVRDYISKFDRSHPDQRLALPEISFDIEVPDEVIATINIDEVKELLVNHPTLQLHEV